MINSDPMKPERRRPFDPSYYLLFPFLAVALIPWLKYKVPFRFLLPVPILWLVMNLGAVAGKRVPPECKRLFIRALLLLGAILFLNFGFGFFQGVFALPGSADFIDMCVVVFSFCMFHFSLNANRIKELRILVVFSLVCLGVSAAINIVGLQEFSEGSRIITAASSEGTSLVDIEEARSAGIGGFGYIYGIGLLSIPVLYASRMFPAQGKLAAYVFVFLCLLSVLKARYSILVLATLIAGGALLLSFLRMRKRAFNSAMVILIAVLVLVMAAPTVLSFLESALTRLSDMTDDPTYTFRILSMRDTVLGVEDSYAGYRSNLYWNSWNIFLQAPLVGFKGTADPTVFGGNILGGHSFIFDTLGGFGVVGASIYIWFFLTVNRYFRIVTQAWGLGQLSRLSSLLFYPLIFIAFLNPIWGYPILFDYLFLVPGLMFLRKPPQYIAFR